MDAGRGREIAASAEKAELRFYKTKKFNRASLCLETQGGTELSLELALIQGENGKAWRPMRVKHRASFCDFCSYPAANATCAAFEAVLREFARSVLSLPAVRLKASVGVKPRSF